MSLGHRTVKRVPLDFDWPLDTVWGGYLTPDRFQEDKCLHCENGQSPEAKHLNDLWYGYVLFDPTSTGSVPFTVDTPAIRKFAERHVQRDPWFYGSGEAAIVREAQRVVALWNGQWCHHLAQEDVDALVAGNRLWDFTRTWSKEDGWVEKDPPVTPNAAEVNDWSINGYGHDSINNWVVIRARCEKEGVPYVCGTCDGHSSLEKYPGQRDEAEAWEYEEPPVGDGWQLWTTTTEGSPISPVFATPEELAEWCAPNATIFADDRMTVAQWLSAFLEETVEIRSMLLLTDSTDVTTS